MNTKSLLAAILVTGSITLAVAGSEPAAAATLCVNPGKTGCFTPKRGARHGSRLEASVQPARVGNQPGDRRTQGNPRLLTWIELADLTLFLYPGEAARRQRPGGSSLFPASAACDVLQKMYVLCAIVAKFDSCHKENGSYCDPVSKRSQTFCV